jgi:hypothetical protein
MDAEFEMLRGVNLQRFPTNYADPVVGQLEKWSVKAGVGIIISPRSKVVFSPPLPSGDRIPTHPFKTGIL